MAKYVAAIDQGTTSTRCMIFNHAGEPVGVHQMEHEQIYPKPGWVEHDPGKSGARTQDVVREAMRKAGCLSGRTSLPLGVTNQRETTVVWTRQRASHSTTPLSGKTPAQPASATNWPRMVGKTASGPK